jgi:D-beta-D-heptose 7-phosphate kinase/D-beta-D-heptose 1-phosphate adenosyltransferase
VGGSDRKGWKIKNLKSKIKPLSQIISIRNLARKQGKTVVFTNGVFDLLHRGHVDYLRRARALGDLLILGLNTDASTRRLKGPLRPLMKQADRAEVLSALESVDQIVLFNEDTPARLIAKLLPDILVKGADYREKDIVGSEAVRAYGGRVVRMKYLKGYSTTRLIRNILRRSR